MAKSFDKINKRINRSQAKRSAVARKIDKFIANGKKYSLRSFLGKKQQVH